MILNKKFGTGDPSMTLGMTLHECGRTLNVLSFRMNPPKGGEMRNLQSE
jgi:hypothetical protein